MIKKSISFLIFVTVFMTELISQNTDLARIRIYRNEKILCSTADLDVQLNGHVIYTMPSRIVNAGACEYIMSSQGLVQVKISNWERSWGTTTVLNIEAGKTYFLKINCSLTGLSMMLNPAESELEWPRVGAYESIVEDPNEPIIVGQSKSTPTHTVTRVDTIKQIVYVNTPQPKKYSYEAYSDVDFDIPNKAVKNDLRFALIIGNEDYSSFQSDLKSSANVSFARNDASAMKAYLINAMGVPERNVTCLLDATYGQMQQALAKINLIIKNTGGKAEIVFYYAGHGMPDQESKEPYLIPVDISGTTPNAGVKLNDVLAKLSEFPCKRVMVFLDACFTGGARNEGLLASRGVDIKPKAGAVKGNMIVFNASSDTQSALAYEDKHHGMFTYFLLKKIKEDSSVLTLGELSKYITEKVALESVIVNSKEQNPQINVGTDINDQWGSWKLIEP